MPVRQSVSQTVSQSADQPIPTDSKTTQEPHAPTPICPSLTYTPHPSPHLVPTPPHPPPPFTISFYPLLLLCVFYYPRKPKRPFLSAAASLYVFCALPDKSPRGPRPASPGTPGPCAGPPPPSRARGRLSTVRWWDDPCEGGEGGWSVGWKGGWDGPYKGGGVFSWRGGG